MDDSKDVACLFYSPHCPASQAIIPVFDALAKEFASDGTKVLTKLDMLKNDIPMKHIKVTHYPSLWLFPRGHKDAPIDYKNYNHEADDGDREHSHYELGMMIDFIRHKDHHVREAHHDGGFFTHINDK